MSQLPEMPAAGWSEQDYDPSAYGRQEEAPPAQGPAPQQYGQPHAVWQQDTEPDWGASQQGYAGAQAEPTMVAPDSGSGLPTEFDHLFRDSTPDTRRAIDRQKPVVGGAAPGYLNGAQPAEAAGMAEAAGAEHMAAPPGAPYQGAQFSGAQFNGAQFGQGPGQLDASQYQSGAYQDPQYQGMQFQGGQYGHAAGYPQDAMGYGGPGGYDDGYGGPGDGGPRNRRALIIGGAVAVVAVIGIVVAFSSNGSPGKPRVGSGTPTAVASKVSPKQQADQIYQLIEQSGQLRSAANTGVIDVNSCKNLTDAQTLLSDTAQKRQAQADSVAKIDVTGIQNGTELVDQLKAAWTASAQYDSAYAQIAGDLQGGCKASAVRKDPNYQTSNQQASAADNAKAQAAQLWNANVAAPLGESQITEGKL